jgi:hypothetical protein
MSNALCPVLNAVICRKPPLRAARANRISGTDKSNPYQKYGSGKSKDSAGVLNRIDDPHGRFFVRAMSYLTKGTGP